VPACGCRAVRLASQAEVCQKPETCGGRQRESACYYVGRASFHPRHVAGNLKCLPQKGLRRVAGASAGLATPPRDDVCRAALENFRSRSAAARHCGASTCGDRSAARAAESRKIRAGPLDTNSQILIINHNLRFARLELAYRELRNDYFLRVLFRRAIRCPAGPVAVDEAADPCGPIPSECGHNPV